jgi:hypothetical protein
MPVNQIKKYCSPKYSENNSEAGNIKLIHKFLSHVGLLVLWVTGARTVKGCKNVSGGGGARKPKNWGEVEKI